MKVLKWLTGVVRVCGGWSGEGGYNVMYVVKRMVKEVLVLRTGGE